MSLMHWQTLRRFDAIIQVKCGKRADDYSVHRMTTLSHSQLKEEVISFESHVHLNSMNFQERIIASIMEGDAEEVDAVIEEAGEHIRVSNTSGLLFRSVDCCQPDLTAHLIRHGWDPDIWQTYEDASEDDIDLKDSAQHGKLTSLEERAREQGFEPLADYIVRVRSSKSNEDGSEARNSCMSDCLAQNSAVW